ncbi:MAG: primosomal protein N', partial [Clostridia bacterium]
KLDEFTAINEEMLSLIPFMRQTFFLKIVDCLRLFIPSEMRGGKVKEQKEVFLSLKNDVNLNEIIAKIRKGAKNQIGLIEYIRGKKEEKQSVLNAMFGDCAVKKIFEFGAFEKREETKNRSPKFMEIFDKEIKFTAEQEHAISSVEMGSSGSYLLHGVTGSGKTEVYMALIKEALKNGKTAIMLVPEISLTPQVLANFKNKFGDKVAILHSGLSAGERFDEWRRLEVGDAKIAVGARSAVFAPLKNLGVIIVDEEHDQSYVSDSNPRYTTEMIATFRSCHNKCPLVLGSATPSVESYRKTQIGEWKLLELPERINGRPLPTVQIVDMLSEVKTGGNLMFSPSLLRELNDVVKNKKQAMLFINRRGFSSFLMCKDCGYVAKCTDCDVSLVYHKEENLLKCHYCGKKFKALTMCPNCKSTYIKQGAIGTEKVVYELSKIFPDVKILRMDNDTTKTKNSHQKILEEFSQTLPSILVGTQMIAKGHDFKDVTFVGILDADQSLFHSDYRSTEKTFQLITQVSGRAGRSESEGKVVLQTFCPKHYVYKFASNYNYKGFYEKEINLRETTEFPPFSKIIRVLFVGEIEENVRENAKLCYNNIELLKKTNEKDFIYLGATKSPMSKIMNKFRYQIVLRIKLENEKEITSKINEIMIAGKTKKVSSFLEVDPQNLI